MSINEFGKFMRILRIKKEILMKDTANVLEVKTPFLSAVENGKKKIPADWYKKICDAYDLTDSEKIELKKAIEESSNQIKINLVNCDEHKKNLAFQFQRSFPDLDKKTSERIINILKGDD